MLTKLVIVALVAFGQLAFAIPVQNEEIEGTQSKSEEAALLVEFDRMFNQLASDINYKLRVYRMNHTVRVKNLNAQFISRYAITITEIQHMKQHAKEAILDHALDIGTQNPCIVEKNDEAVRRATQAGRDLAAASEKAYSDLATINRIYFLPLVKQFQSSASEFQWVTTAKVEANNPVNNLQTILRDLAFHYQDNEGMVDQVISGLEHELESFQYLINNVRREVFTKIDYIGRSYLFNMEQLIAEALRCE
ncbi:uncharacterized protein LOC129739976 [Uranotaenia lowii]|uniref:uncharacterized protein LOC129739976 n=1 Tax=Uranotaenia lowii TaxID=190385 RepID=UPI00247A19C1|nr:uncharacterized protein LOC129739976 [Uranotaenia lowii]